MGNDEDFEEGEEKTKLLCGRLLNPLTVVGHHHSVCPPRERVGGGGMVGPEGNGDDARARSSSSEG
uniref:Uncharacterized protein n=1 Tax=Oryza glumipatula TaxID=40148 RepID=A0A0D9Z1U2_9ORYZ